MIATGTFEVDLQPLEAFAQGSAGVSLGRLSITKTYRGDLQGFSLGEMLTAITPVEGSAGYVAIEQVDGKLHGRRGTFVLQHAGSMARGEQRLFLEVVPDSGTGDLVGLRGSMAIRIEGDRHYYELDYQFA